MTNEDSIKIIKQFRDRQGNSRDDNEAFDKAINSLEQQPKTGHWIKTGDYYTGAYESLDYFECSCCHEESLEEGDYCPNCGADMRGDTE